MTGVELVIPERRGICFSEQRIPRCARNDKGLNCHPSTLVLFDGPLRNRLHSALPSASGAFIREPKRSLSRLVAAVLRKRHSYGGGCFVCKDSSVQHDRQYPAPAIAPAYWPRCRY